VISFEDAKIDQRDAYKHYKNDRKQQWDEAILVLGKTFHAYA